MRSNAPARRLGIGQPLDPAGSCAPIVRAQWRPLCGRHCVETTDELRGEDRVDEVAVALLVSMSPQTTAAWPLTVTVSPSAEKVISLPATSPRCRCP